MKKKRQLQLQLEKRAMRQLIVAILILIAVFVSPLIFAPAELDPTTNCPKLASLQPPRSTTLFVDLSDDMPSIHTARVLTITNNIADGLQRYERFSLFVLRNDRLDKWTPIFSQCNPGKPMWTDYLSKGRRELRANFDKTFTKVLKDSLKLELARNQPSPHSPIIEAIRTITRSGYWGPNNRLYMLTDLMENSSMVSLYSRDQNFASTAQKRQNKVVFDNLNLRNTNVGICLTEYAPNKLAPELQANAIRFWKDLFSYTHASCVEISCQISGQQCRDNVSQPVVH